MGRYGEFGGATRVQVVGPCGAGKSTFARRLGAVLGVPVIHGDQLFWRAGWVQAPSDEIERDAREAMAGPAWVFDGNYGARRPDRLTRVQHVIHLDYPRRIHMRRVLWRIATTWGRVRDDMSPGCPERLDGEFLLYTWRFRSAVSPALRERIDHMAVPCHTLRHPRETEALFTRLSR